MEMHQLEAFIVITKVGSFTAAARELHVTQPAITRQIACLEAELHTRLFDRLGKRVHLTSSGQALHQYAETIVRLAHEAARAVADTRYGDVGNLTIGASNTLATYVLPSILRAFHEKHPGIEIGIHTGLSSSVVDMVRANEVDLGLVTSSITDPRLITTLLADYETCVVAPPDHPLAQNQQLAIERLAAYPLILMDSSTNLRTYVQSLLSAAGVDEQVTMELDNVEAIKRMVEAGLGISLLPIVAVTTEVQAGRLCAIRLADVPRASRQIVLVRRVGKYTTNAVHALLQLLQTTYNSAI